MPHVQIRLTDDQYEALKRRAAGDEDQIPSQVIDAVDALIANDGHEAQVQRALDSVGGFHSGLGDLAERHDDYLADPQS